MDAIGRGLYITHFTPEDEAAGILAAIVDSSDDAIIANDLNGVILTWNRGAQRMYGYSAEEITGRSVSLLVPDGQPDELALILEGVRAGQRIEHHKTVRKTKDGRLVDVSLTVSPIRDATGRVVGASAIARDISAGKRAEEALRASELRWRSIVESAVDGIVVIDARGRIEAFNPAAERLFGYTEQEVVGRNVSMLMPAPYRDEHDGYLAHYLATGEQKIIGIGREVVGLRRDGHVFPLHLSVGEVSVEGQRKFTGILHDLTRRVQLEEQLREQTSLARIGEMAAVIAHEVRNPLAGIRGAIQVIGSHLSKDSRDASVVKEIVARIDALNELIKDLLLFARPPKPRSAPVDIAALLATIADLLSQDPALKQVRVEVVGSAPPITADAELLKIVFQNLMVNSAHAMQGHGHIAISVKPEDGCCRIAVKDTGPGIRADVREKLFTPFFTTKSRGTGLGLSTAKRLVEAHRGTISVECPPEGGTTVTVQLPG